MSPPRPSRSGREASSKASPTTGASASSDDASEDDDEAEYGEDDSGLVEGIYEVGREHHRLSLLDYLDVLTGPIDRRAVQQAAREGRLLLNGEPVGPGVTLKQGDEVRVEVPPETLQRKTRRSMVVLHSENGLAVGDKPSGLSFDAGRYGGGKNALEELRTSLQTQARPRPVHRLDKPTSGVVVAALDNETEQRLLDAFRDGRAHVEYLGVARGRFDEDEGVFDVPLGKRKKSDAVLRPDPRHGTPCETTWRVLERLSGFAVLLLQPRDGGRSHQVRAHMAASGYPLLCDRDYGEDDRLLMSQLKIGYRRKRGRPERPLLERPALHAQAFVLDGLRVESPLPNDLTVLLAQIRRLRGTGGEGDDEGGDGEA